MDFKTKNGKTALHIACENGNYDIVQVLVKSGASVDAQTNDGKTALHIASEKGLVNIVEVSKLTKGQQRYRFQALIRKKASPNVVSSNDMTPLHLATQNGHDYVMQVSSMSGKCFFETAFLDFDREWCRDKCKNVSRMDTIAYRFCFWFFLRSQSTKRRF